MTAETAPAHRPGRRPMKSPLAAHSHGTAAITRTRTEITGTSKSLRDAVNRRVLRLSADDEHPQRPTVRGCDRGDHVFVARALDRWMTVEGIDGVFTVADSAMLNRFLRDYFRQHGQGGMHSQQRNMRHLFSDLARETGDPHSPANCLA